MEDYNEDKSLLVHLTVTGRCYAQCEGCVNSAITLGLDQPRNQLEAFQETEPERDAQIIRLLSEKFPDADMTVCFYGGEPFLALDRMVKVWKLLKTSGKGQKFKFLVYTNGELIIQALDTYPEFMQDLWTLSVSIDGRREQHNRVRKGTRLDRVVENLEALSSLYKGNILFWSTLRESQSLYDCFEEFQNLYEKRLVTHFFWHWAEHKEPFSNFSAFARNYGADLEKIMAAFVRQIFKGDILPITHINELILYSLMGKERGHTACGVEVSKNYDVVSGRVFPCADLPSDSAVGELDAGGRLLLKDSDLSPFVSYKKKLGCFDCGVHAYCGGRCPVQAIAGSWERVLQYCQLMRMHVGIVQEHISDIFRALQKNSISLQNVYDSSAFLAKYTDVVP